MTTPHSPLKKVTIRLESNQYHMLRKLYPNIGYNGIIRALVEKHLKAMEFKVAARLAAQIPLPLLDITVDGLDEILTQKEDQDE